jgi:hypothetical protein
MDELDKKMNRREKTREISDDLKLPPLKKEVIEKMDVDECRRLIEERYKISTVQLFKRVMDKKYEKTWNVGERTKLALFRLEGIPFREITDFYDVEFGRLARVEDYFVEESNAARLIASRYFSRLLNDTIDKRLAFLHTLEGVQLNPKIVHTIKLIEQATDLSAHELFTGNSFTLHVKFSPQNILKAFLLKVSNPDLTARQVFNELEMAIDEGRSENALRLMLSEQFNKIFTPKAVRLTWKRR